MALLEVFFTKIILPVFKSIGIWWCLQKRNKSKLCSLMIDMANDYSKAPKISEDMYMTLVVLFRYPMIRDSQKITVNSQPIYEIERIKKLHEKCTDAFSTVQNKAIVSVVTRALKINNDLKGINLSKDNIEQQKNISRQILLDWCYVLFMLNKIGSNGSKFTPLNNDPAEFNKVIRERFGVVTDENLLFENGLKKYGITIVAK